MYKVTQNGIEVPEKNWLDRIAENIALGADIANAKIVLASLPSLFCPARTCFTEDCINNGRHSLCPEPALIRYRPNVLLNMLGIANIKKDLLLKPNRNTNYDILGYLEALETLIIELIGKDVAFTDSLFTKENVDYSGLVEYMEDRKSLLERLSTSRENYKKASRVNELRNKQAMNMPSAMKVLRDKYRWSDCLRHVSNDELQSAINGQLEPLF